MARKQRITHLRIQAQGGQAKYTLYAQSRRGTRYAVGTVLAGHPKADGPDTAKALVKAGLAG